jgi:hypothetical protein
LAFRKSAIKYEAEIKADKFILIADGTREELERAKGILGETSPVAAPGGSACGTHER